jgi:hypothetical protein
MTRDALADARAFLDREGRLIERRLAAVLSDGADRSGVFDAVRAYRNADGGFGHGMEPDKRCPASLPIDVECALDIHLAAGWSVASRGDSSSDTEVGRMVVAACDWLASVAAPDGAVPLAFPVIEAYPRASHFTDWTYEPGLNPTAGIAGRLHRMGVVHPWLDTATEWTWRRLDQSFDEDAHSLAEVLIFLAHVPDRTRAEKIADQIPDWLHDLRWFRADPRDPEYGVTPLHFARTPDSPWRELFDDEVIEGHLDRMLGDQQQDGGWPITWEPPSTASTLDWRGIETMRALRTLRAYGRL